ncbi:hypothetical protein KKB99_03790 [bacterium]|nr:hypothetical protein [bacterium]MBU1025114.1 hypothetical protein [bacterium]
MKKILYVSSLNVLLLVCLCLLLNALGGCNNLFKNADLKIASMTKNTNKSQLVVVDNQYYPLNVELLNDIRNGNFTFSDLYLGYSTFTPVSNQQIFNIGYGNFSGNFNFLDITEFDSGLYQSFHNPTVGYLKHVFTHNEVDSILAFISSPENSGYFFNAEEYNGLDIPYLNASICPNDRNFNFSLIFFKPETYPNQECWAIFKCVDEYPSPEHPLYDLFQMLENDFISQFE